jgi:hypothetical protein
MHKVVKPITPLDAGGTLRLNEFSFCFIAKRLEVLAEQVARLKVCVCLRLIKKKFRRQADCFTNFG